MYVNELINHYNQNVEFNTCIGMLRISEDKNIYNSIRLKYEKLADEYTKDFQERWDGYEDIKSKLDNYEKDMNSILMQGIVCVREDLLSCNVVDQDDESILERGKKLKLIDPFYNALTEFHNKIGAVTKELQQKKQAREIRKETRGRWQGGTISTGNQGFLDTYKDNLEFQLELGAMNLIEGLGHSAVNAIGNSISENNARDKINRIAHDERNRELLANGLNQTIKNLHLILIALLNKSEVWTPPSDDAVQKSTRLLNNSSSSIVSGDTQKEILKEAWELNPYNKDFYKKLIELDTEHSVDITKISEYFGLDIADMKDEYALEFLHTLELNTEEKAWKAKDDLLELYKVLGIDSFEDLKSYKELQSIIEKYDIEYRTIDSFVCSTREKADMSREELPLIAEFMKDIQPPSKDSLLDYEKNLLEKKAQFESTFSSEISEKYKNKIEEYLKEFDNLFCGVGILGAKMDRKAAGRSRAVKYAKSLDVATEEKMQESIRLLKDFLPLVGISEDEAQEAYNALEKRREKIVNPNSAQKIFGKLGGILKK